MFRVLAGSLTIVAAFGAQAFAAGPPSEDIPVPGGTVALARAIGLETPPDASRFVAEVARLTYGLPDGHRDDPSSTLRRLTAHLDAAGRFQAAVGALPNGAVRIALAASNGDTREQLKTVLELIGLRLRENRGTYTVDAANDAAAAARVQHLEALGLNLERLETRLNAGETVQLKLPMEWVPVPLTSVWWSEAVFRRSVPAPDLFAAILASPRAALLGHGLAALDDETLQYVADNHRLVERLGGDDAPVFATFAGNLRVHAGRVVTPGGLAAVPLWESVVDAKTTDPGAFIRSLLSRDSGHLAYLYDLIAELDAPRAAFALGLWIQEDRARIVRFQSLVSAVHSGLEGWQVRETPFARPLNDIGWMLLNMTVDANGAPRGPVARRLWSRVFETLDLPGSPADALKAVERVDRDGPMDAAWLADTIVAGDPKLRSVRLQQLAFGLRVFGGASGDGLGDVLTAVRALPSYPALMLTLERMAITDPSVYAAAARAALSLSDLEGTAAYIALNQFQGALALLSGMTAAGSLEPDRARALVATLVAVPRNEGRYGTLVAEWVRGQLLPAIVVRNDADQAVLAALAGANTRTPAGPVRVEWEGEPYRLDLPAAEERRLRSLRARQRTFSIETALDLERIARELRAESVGLPAIQTALAALRELLPTLTPANASGRKAVLPAGVENLPDARATVDRAVKALSKITRPRDARKAIRIAEPLGELSGVVLGEALSGVVYALHLGDQSGGIRLEVDLSRRHDFGLELKENSARRSTSWLVPRQLVEPGAPRRVIGSLLGLDMAFSELSLRRVALGTAEDRPVLLSNDRDTFTKSVTLLNPHSMRDADRDLIATAVAKGSARVSAAATSGSAGPDALEALAEEIRMDGWRRRAARWEIAHDARRLPSLFSLNELLALGGGHSSSLDGWGMAGTPISGCLCTQLAAPNEWRIVSGRPQIGAMGTVVPDLNLQVAVVLSTLRLPAPLAKIVVGAVVQEFVEHVRPTDPGDWLTLVRAASVVSRERIEDYVAAATVDGPLVPESKYQERQP